MTLTQIKRFREHPDVVLADCTYKTNQYKLPLLQLLGASGNNQTFQIATALLSGEKEEDFSFHFQSLKNSMTQNGIKTRLFVVDRCQAAMNAIDEVWREEKIPQVRDVA